MVGHIPLEDGIGVRVPDRQLNLFFLQAKRSVSKKRKFTSRMFSHIRRKHKKNFNNIGSESEKL